MGANRDSRQGRARERALNVETPAAPGSQWAHPLRDRCRAADAPRRPRIWPGVTHFAEADAPHFPVTAGLPSQAALINIFVRIVVAFGFSPVARVAAEGPSSRGACEIDDVSV